MLSWMALLLLLLTIIGQCGSDTNSPLVSHDFNWNCSYKYIIPTEPSLLGLYFFQLGLSPGTSLNVSYSWKDTQYTDNWFYNGTNTVSSHADSSHKCFENDDHSRNLFWSDTEFQIAYNGNGENKSCAGYELGYKAMYWADTCIRYIQVGSEFDLNGTFIFPMDDAFYPCNLTCKWTLWTPIVDASNQEYIGVGLRYFLSESRSANISVVGSDEVSGNITTCNISGSTEVGKGIYLGKLGQTVTITFTTGINIKGLRLKIEYTKLSANSNILETLPGCDQDTIGRVYCQCVTTTGAPPSDTITKRFRKALEYDELEAVQHTVQARTNASLNITCVQCENEGTAPTVQKYKTSTGGPNYGTVYKTAKIIADDLAFLKDNITADNVEEKMSNLSDILTNVNTILTPQNVIDAVDALAAATNISGISLQAGSSFDVCVDLILQKGNRSFIPKATETLLKAVHNYAVNVNLTVGQSSEYYNGSSFVNIVTVVDCREPEFQVGLLDNNGTLASPILNTMAIGKKTWPVSLAFIRISPEVVCLKRKKRNANVTGVEATRVSFQIYRTTNIFQSVNDTSTNSLDVSFCRSKVTVGNVAVSATVIKRSANNSATPPMSVQVGFCSALSSDNLKFARNFKTDCAYWTDKWAVTDQVKLINRTGDNYLFQANHLTDFTLLVSNNPKDPIFCEIGLSVLGKVGASCSFVGLTTVTASLVSIWLLGQSNRPLVLVCLCSNLCFDLFFLCFILFADQETLPLNDSLCTAFAAVMYYLLMSTMIWTCCRAALVYKRYVVVFETGGHSDLFSFNRVSTFIAIALPFIVILTVGLTYNSFFQRSDFFCWINPVYSNYAVIIPISMMLVISIIVLILVVRSVFFGGKTTDTDAIRSKEGIKKDIRRKIWVVFVIQISLGLPWIFLYMTTIPGTSMFHYLFTITNAFQGVWIAALHFYERRKDIRKLFGRITRFMWPFQRQNHSLVTLERPLDSLVNSPKVNARANRNKFELTTKPFNSRLKELQESETELTQRK